MRRSTLGRSGLHVSSLALGTMQWGGRTDLVEARAMLGAYLDAGGTLVDTAHGYAGGASEEMVGTLVGERGRDAFTLCTKAGISRSSGSRVVDTSRGTLITQLDTSLGRLGTDHVDLWLVHAWSDATPLEETLSALEFAASSGRARYVGVSNYGGWQLARATTLAAQSRVPIIANQVEYSLLERIAEHEIVPAAVSLGVGLMAWAPLAGGVLAGRYRTSTPADSRGASADLGRYVTDRMGPGSQGVVEAIVTAARGLDTTPTAVALAWLRDRTGMSCAVVGSRTEVQLRQVLDGVDIDIPAQVTRALDDVSSISL
ncbi:MAG: aldo/keto reductase [Nostocoides sp.]